MAWTGTNPVAVGGATKKSDYDALWDNADYLYANLSAPATTNMLFKQNAAPLGWTRDSTPQDNAMLCIAASGNIGSGGSETPQAWNTGTQTLNTSGTVGSVALDTQIVLEGSALHQTTAGAATKAAVINTVSTASFAPYYQECICCAKD